MSFIKAMIIRKLEKEIRFVFSFAYSMGFTDAVKGRDIGDGEVEDICMDFLYDMI